jgi:hypothetical protein
MEYESDVDYKKGTWSLDSVIIWGKKNGNNLKKEADEEFELKFTTHFITFPLGLFFFRFSQV